MAISDHVLKNGDIVVVPFPYSDRLSEKRRPALVISATAFNQRHGLVWVAMITSAENNSWTDDIDLPLAKTGLNTASVVRIAKITTIESNRIVRKIGNVEKATSAKISAAIGKLLA